jgi:ribulose-phosphate 3-epimerase
MNSIIPAIIPKSFAHLQESLSIVRPFTREVQVDVVDGKFVPFTSWPYLKDGAIEDLQLFTPTFTIEVDLMLENPEEVIPTYARVGVKKIVVHGESTKMLERIFIQKRELGFSLGLSINNDSPLSMIEEHRNEIDYVQLMGIAKIGSQGQPFDTRVLERVRTLREKYPELTISIDGSVNAETLVQLKDAGANRFVSGSAIFGEDNPEQAFSYLSSL